MSLNVKDPLRPERPVFLCYLSKAIFDKFQSSIQGGFCVSSCFYSFWNGGRLDKDDTKNTSKNQYQNSEDYNHVNHGYFVDFNSLYPRLAVANCSAIAMQLQCNCSTFAVQ